MPTLLGRSKLLVPASVVVTCAVASTVGGCESGSSTERSSTVGDSLDPRDSPGRHLSARCDRALEDPAPAPVRTLDAGSSAWGPAEARFGTDGPPLGSVNGAAWRESDSALYVLDGLSQRVRVYGGDGSYRFSFGGEGEGPGEFDDVHGGELNPDRIAVSDGGHVAVRGRRFVHLFRADGGFVTRVEQETNSQGPMAKLNIASFSDSSFVMGETHAWDFQTQRYEVRTRLSLRVVTPGTSHLETFALRRNGLARLPRFEGNPPRSPYRDEFVRLWDAVGSGLLAVPSLESHGVCFFGNDLEIVGAHLVDAPVVPVDDGRKDRILDDMREEYGPRAPMIGTPWDEFYGYWPKTLPRYIDVVLRADSTAWLARPVEETRIAGAPDAEIPYAVDVIHARRGYLGSYQATELPVAFKGNCALFVETRVPEKAGTGAIADSAFHGLVDRCPAKKGS